MSRLIITDGSEFYRHIFADAHARIIGFPYEGFTCGNNPHWIRYRFSHSQKLGFPFLKSWNRFVVKQYGAKKGDTILILNNAVWSPYWNNGIISVLKQKGCKLVLFMVDSVCFLDEARRKTIFEAESMVDETYTFDMDDAITYGWTHTYQYYSQLHSISPVGPKTDLFCVTRNNGRLQKLVQLYDLLEKRGASCLFYIHGVSAEEEQANTRKGIVYNQYLSYDEILGRIAQTNVILELVKAGQTGSTLRGFEAIVYGKRLLTNRPLIRSFPFYNSQLMKLFCEPEDVEAIELSFFTSTDHADYSYKNELSPAHLFDTIEATGH